MTRTDALTPLQPPLLRVLDANWFLPACLLLAAVLRAATLALPLQQTSDFLWYYQAASAIARGEGFSERGVLTAFWPVGWPGALAALFTLTGVSAFAGQVANLVMGVAACWLTAVLGERVLDSRAAGRLAALLIAVFPNQIGYVPLLSVEIFYELLLLLGILLLARERAWSAVVAGLVFGVATLTKAQSLVVAGFVLLWVFVASPGWPRLRRVAGLGIAAYVALLLVVAPWTYRNWTVLHAFVPVSTNGGWTLVTGNNPEANGDYTPNTRLVEGINHDPADQVAMDRLANARAIEWIKANPGRFVALLPLKAMRLWAPDGESEWFYQAGFAAYDRYAPVFRAVRVVNQAFYLLLGLLALPTLWRVIRGRAASPWAHAGLALFVLWTLVSLAFSGQSRFHVSLMPFLATYAAHTLVRLAPRQRGAVPTLRPAAS